MKYFTQTTKMQNYGKLYRFLMIAMLVMLTSGMAWADNWPSSTLSTGTYILTTVGTNQFAVNGSGEYDKMAGFTINDSKSITRAFQSNRKSRICSYAAVTHFSNI